MSCSEDFAVARHRIRRGHCGWVSLCLLSGLAGVAILVGPSHCGAQSADVEIFGFTQKYCSSCHNDDQKAGGLDLTTFRYAPGNSGNFLTWVKVHDRVRSGE